MTKGLADAMCTGWAWKFQLPEGFQSMGDGQKNETRGQDQE